jgi:hypothetical protein
LEESEPSLFDVNTDRVYLEGMIGGWEMRLFAGYKVVLVDLTSSGQSRAGVFLHQVFPEIYTRGSRGLVFCIHQRDLRTHQVIL